MSENIEGKDEQSAEMSKAQMWEPGTFVPLEPTDAMMDAAEACSNDWPRTTWKAAWTAMLNAAPASDTVYSLNEIDRLNIKVAMIYLKEAKLHTASDNLQALLDRVSALPQGKPDSSTQVAASDDRWIDRLSYDAQIDEWAIERSNLEHEIERLNAQLAAPKRSETPASGTQWQGGPAPQDGSAFYAYHPSLADADFNPWGVVEAAFDGEKIVGAVWNGVHDCWDTLPIQVELWRHITGPRIDGDKQGKPDSSAQIAKANEQNQAAIDFLDKKAADFAREFGSMDMQTGLLHFDDEDHAETYAELLACVAARRNFTSEGAAPERSETPAAWEPIQTMPVGKFVLCAGEMDGLGDWRMKMGQKDGRTGKITLLGGSWKPTRWMPLPPVPRIYDDKQGAQEVS